MRFPQPPSFSAATMFLRAAGLTSGAVASSRSRNTWSAGRIFAFSRKRGLLPGTARHDRRGRSGSVMVASMPPGADYRVEVVAGVTVLLRHLDQDVIRPRAGDESESANQQDQPRD